MLLHIPERTAKNVLKFLLLNSNVQLIREAFGKAKEVQLKTSELDLVTETDLSTEVILIEGIKNKFPTHR